MIDMPPLRLWAVALLCACAAEQPLVDADDCTAAAMIGRFDPSRDLLVANYDSKPDVDDLQAVAALGTILRDPRFACVDYIATHGAYGTQTGKFLPAAKLFDLAFGNQWVDAHADRELAVSRLVGRVTAALSQGGTIWVTEAGQSDVTAAVLRRVPEAARSQVHVIQHSDWNESVTSAEALAFVKAEAQYHKIADGNFPDNGTPAFNTNDGSAWPRLTGHPTHGAAWTEARRLSLRHNPVAEYVNPAVEAGGLDFSDTVEAAWLFGFEDMAGVDDFVARFAVD